MQAAWLAFQAVGRADHPRLRVIFSMLAGLAPLHAERLSARGGPAQLAPDPLLFYETSSYGAIAARALESVVGSQQILYGSDRPVLEPLGEGGVPALDWDLLDEVDGAGAGRAGRRGGSPRFGARAVSAPGAAARRTPSLGLLPRPRGRTLDAGELESFVAELADRPELWIEHVRHDPEQRSYRELLSDEHVTAWLICWMDDHDTGFHDHDSSSGAVAVVSGSVREERLALAGEPVSRTFRAGQSFQFSAADIHRVRHAGEDPAVTLHVYSPPLLRMGAYAIGEEGVLVRHTMSSAEELRPLESDDAD